MATTSKIYVFKGDKYIQIDAPTGTIDFQPSLIGDDWPGLKAIGFDSNLEAAAYCQNRIFFFKGNQYALFDVEAKNVTSNGAITDFFKSLPSDKSKPDSDFTQGIDAALFWPNGYLYLFKGNNYVQGNPALSNESITVGAAGPQTWGWPFPFTLGVHAAWVANNVTAFVRGDSAYFYAGATYTLECMWPGVRDLDFHDLIDTVVALDFELNPPETEPTDD